jgi:hypothetical protein
MARDKEIELTFEKSDTNSEDYSKQLQPNDGPQETVMETSKEEKEKLSLEEKAEIADQVDIAKQVDAQFDIQVDMLDFGLFAIVAFTGKIIETVTSTEKSHMREPDASHRLYLLQAKATFRADTRTRTKPEGTAHKQWRMNPGRLGTRRTCG